MSAHGISRYKGGWALVTGPARKQGLGYAFCRRIASEGINLVLVDVMAEELAARAGELERDYGVEVRQVICDLGQPAPYAAIEEAVEDIAVDLLVCNHVYTPTDAPKILDMTLAEHNKLLDINGRAYMNLIHRFASAMRERGKGSIVIVSSGAGLTSAPYTAAYSANKAFQIAYGEALWYELKGSGVDVLVMIGGVMPTYEALQDFPKWLLRDPAQVVDEVLPAVGRKHLIVPGLANRVFTFMQTKLSSRRRTVKQLGKFMEKGLGR